MSLRPLAILSLVALAAAAAAQDWPQYNGPDHGRRVAGEIGLRSWPEAGPPRVWTTATGSGFSSFCVAGDRVYTLIPRDGRETCVALHGGTGEELWAADLAAQTKYDGGGGSGTPDNRGGDGPRSTPSFADGRVHVNDSQLGVHCLDAKTGAVVWKVDLLAAHEGRNIRWQNAASPLVRGGVVFVGGGGPGQSLLALDAATGAVRWKAYDEFITHATPIAATIHGVEQVIFFLQSGLLAVNPDSGAELWRIDYPYRTSTAASPVVEDDVVYLSAGYGVGAGAYRIVKKADGAFEPELLWRKRNRLMNHWSTPLVKDGHLYGMFSFKKYGEGPLQCVELRTGEIKWSVDGFGPGNCILVGDDLVALSDRGEVVLAEARTDKYVELARADVLRGKCWSSPAFANGQVYVRSTVEGTRLDLSRRTGGD